MKKMNISELIEMLKTVPKDTEVRSFGSDEDEDDAPAPTDTDQMLADRGKRYGEFSKHAEITQGIKAVMFSHPNWDSMQPDQREALEMIAHKIGRIINGDPDYLDSWSDVVGYARLVEKRLTEDAVET